MYGHFGLKVDQLFISFIFYFLFIFVVRSGLNFGSTSVTKFAGSQLLSPDLFYPLKYNLCLTACSPFDFNWGFFADISEVLCRILAKSSFTQFSTIHRVGHCLWESSLNAGFLG